MTEALERLSTVLTTAPPIEEPATLVEGTVMAIGATIRVDSGAMQLSCISFSPVVVGDVVKVLRAGNTNIILGPAAGDTAPHMQFAATGALVGATYDPTLHRAVEWKGTFVFGAGGPTFLITLPVTPDGYTGAWAINGDRAANASKVEGIQEFGANSFKANIGVATGAAIRLNFGCTYWVAL